MSIIDLSLQILRQVKYTEVELGILIQFKINIRNQRRFVGFLEIVSCSDYKLLAKNKNDNSREFSY